MLIEPQRNILSVTSVSSEILNCTKPHKVVYENQIILGIIEISWKLQSYDIYTFVIILKRVLLGCMNTNSDRFNAEVWPPVYIKV